jgi:sulfur carrier protein
MVATREVVVNGAPRQVAARTVTELLAELGRDPTGAGLAVAVNGEVAPRHTWSGRQLGPGDRIEIVGAAQGG